MKNDSATKADLKKTADGLHKEISGVETRLNARLTETKNELQKEIATVRTELNSKIDSVEDKLDRRIEHVAVAVVQVSADLQEFKQETRKQHNEVMTAVDGLAKMVTDTRTEIAAFNHAFNRHEKTLEDHETRIGLLERKNL